MLTLLALLILLALAGSVEGSEASLFPPEKFTGAAVARTHQLP
jgi:hypothetical protein